MITEEYPSYPSTILRDWLKGEERHTHIGVHGGLSAAEMIVPLVVAPLS